MNEKLELRMYFFVPYQLTGIQQGIQAGHAALEYAKHYGDTDIFKEFIHNHKTWIILNGGTSNSKKESIDLNPDYKYLGIKDIPKGSLDKILRELSINNIQCACFYEPDLNDILTAICFICDERVWNYKKYPDYLDLCEDLCEFNSNMNSIPTCDEWENMLGGKQNIFLRELLKTKKLA